MKNLLKVYLGITLTVGGILLLAILLSGCTNKQVLVGKRCLQDNEPGIQTITKSYIWFVDKDNDWSEALKEENCN